MSGITTHERRVIRDAVTWDAVWNQAMSRGSDPPELPLVDFNGEMVVLAAMGEQSSGGFAIVIDSVAEQDDGLEVTVVEVSPGCFCAVTTALTQPFTAVRVPRNDGEVRFVEHQLTIDCTP
jgi:hypothetical protein